MKKYVKIVALVLIGLIFLGTFSFLYQKSKPQTLEYETLTTTIADLEKTTVATGKIEPRDEILIKPQISGIIDVVYKEAGETVKKAEDSNATVLRMYEAYNKKTDATVTLAYAPTRVTLVDMMENEIEEIPVSGNSFTLNIKPYEIITVKVEQ